MTAAPRHLRRPDAAARGEVSAPLDLLLADAASSPLRRFLPGMSGVRFAGALARRPGIVAGRTATLARELGRVVGRALRARPAPQGPPLRRRGLVEEPVPAPHAAGLPRGRRGRARRRRGRRPGLGRRPADGLHRRQPRRGHVAEQPPAAQPQGAQAGHRHRRRQPRRGHPAPGARLRDRAAGAVDGRARRVRGRHGPRDDAGRRRAAHRRLRADPVRPADPAGPRRPAADRAADDQQVLRHRPRTRPEPGRAPGLARASRSTASPGATPTSATPTGASTPTPARSSRRWTPPRTSRARTRSRCSPSAPAA